MIFSFFYFIAQFQNIQKKKVEQTQRKALVQELEERQLQRRAPKTAAPRGSFTSYATSDDDVFYDAVRYKKTETFLIKYHSFFFNQESTYYALSTTDSTNS